MRIAPSIIATTPVDLVARLRCLADGREWPQAERQAAPQIISGVAKPDAKLCFTMTGQGGQWWAMGRELLAREPVFRETIERFDAVFAPVGGWSVMDVLLADEATSRIDDAAITPAVMFAFQTALAEVWRTRGVVPDIVLGHSFGEVTAAYLAGGLEAAEIARLVNQRGLIRHSVDRTGTMAAIGLGAEEIAPLLPADGSIEIGGYNAPGMVTLTGEEAAIDRLIARLNADDPTVLTRKLALDFAYHSSWFEPVEHVFKAHVGALRTALPRLPVVSTVTGRLNDRFDTDYWWQNLRRPVRYQQAIETALDLGADVFVELGPHRTLSSMTAACAAGTGRAVVTVTSLDRRWGDLVSIAVATAQLYTAGVEIDWAALLGGHGRSIELPRQPWDNQPLWLEPDEAAHQLRPAIVHPLLGRTEAGPGHAWLSDISLATHGWLGDHRLDGAIVFPAAAYLEMLTVAARTACGADAIELTDVAFPAALFIGGDDEIQLSTRFEPSRRKLTIHSRVRGTAEWTERAAATAFAFGFAFGPGAEVHCDDRAQPRGTRSRPQRHGRVEPGSSPSRTGEDPGSSWSDLTFGPLVRGRREGDVLRAPILLPLPEAEPIDVAAFYSAARDAGYGWGRQFQGLTAIASAPGAARGVIALPEAAASAGFHIDPRLLDSALQLMLASGDEHEMLGMMPVGIARVVVSGSPGVAAVALGRTSAPALGDGIMASIEIAGGDGSIVVRIEGLRAKRREARARPNAPLSRLYAETFDVVTVPAASSVQDSPWIVLAAAGSALGARLVAALTARGASCVSASSNADLARALLDAAGERRRGLSTLRIVYALPLAIDDPDDGEIGAAAARNAQHMIACGRVLSTLDGDGAKIELTVLTRGARAVCPGEAIDSAGLAQSPVLAAARTIAMEVPALELRLVDCDTNALGDTSRMLDVLSGASVGTEIAIRAGEVLSLRLDELGRDSPPPTRVVEAGARAQRNFALRHAGPPGADGLSWRETARRAIGADEVEVEVAAVGLNFRDLMAVSGVLPTDAEPSAAIQALGLELAGSVRSVGGNVRDLVSGDHVLGMARGTLCRSIVMPRGALVRAPGGLSHRDAATIPSAYMTAHYALDELARLQPGETVLVHSATGGVGLAAIALARRAKARIIATAGTAERRDYLHHRGIVDVFDSHSPAFADDVRCATSGRGVDVVLNALAGPLIDKGLACLAPYGRFIELGKRDVYGNAALGMKALKSNISFHVVDLAALLAERPAVAARLLAEVMAMLARGEIETLPSDVFEAGRVADAFRHFASGRHVGKIVVDLASARVDVRSGIADGAPFDAQGTYLVTGGTRGFGLAVGRWLARSRRRSRGSGIARRRAGGE